MDETSIDVIASAVGHADLGALGVASSPDGALTLLFCEFANMAVLRIEVPADRLSTLLGDQRMIVERIARIHGSEIARAHDDGLMLVFGSAHAAMHSAIELQQAFAGVTLDGGPTPQLRVGLHTGTVIDSGEDLYGRNVLLGARIAGEAVGGEILVSAKVREYTQSDPSFEFRPRGEFHFRGLHGEHELFAVSWRDPAERVPERDG